MSEIPSELRQQIIDAVRDERLLDAVALFRQATGSSLLESKRFCERLRTELTTPGGSPDAMWEGARANDPDASTNPPMSEEIQRDVMALLRRGKKLDAVKLYREATGCSLKESKTRCEEMLADQLSAGGSASGTDLEANLKVDRSSGCFGMLLVLACMIGSATTAGFAALNWLLPKVSG